MIETHPITYHPRRVSTTVPSGWTLTGRAVFDLVAALLVALIVAIPLIAAAQGGFSLDQRTIGLLTVAMLAAVQFSILFFGIRRRRRAAANDEPMPPLFGGGIAAGIFLGILGGAMMLGVSIAYMYLLMNYFGVTPDQGMFESLAALPVFVQIGIAVVAIIGAPIAEEVLFRGAMLGGFKGANKPWLGAVVSSVLFAVAHLNPLLLPAYFLMGMILAGLYIYSRSLLAPMVAHLVNNAVAVGMLVASMIGGF